MKNRLNVLIVSQEYPPNIIGGGGTYIYNLIKNICEDFNIDVLAVKDTTALGKNYPKLDVKVHLIKLKSTIFPLKNIEFMIKASKFVRENGHKYSVIHDNWNCLYTGNYINTVHTTSLQEYHYFKRFRKNIFRWLYGKAGYLLLHIIEKKVFRKSQLIICPSKDIYNHLDKKFAMATKNKKVSIYYSVDTKIFAPKNVRLEDKKFDILYAGRLAERKNIPLLLESLDALKKSLNVLFCVDKGEFLAKLQTWKENTHHKATIVTNANHFDMVNYYNLSKLTVLPSLYESFGLVLAESMACETPVIALRSGGTEQIIENNKTGFLVKNNKNELTNAINKLFSSKKLQHDFGQKGRLRVQNRFDSKKNSLLIKKLYIENAIPKTSNNVT